MKAIEDTQFDQTYPERYLWKKIDSYQLEKVALNISEKIFKDFKTSDRNLVLD